MLPKEPCTLEHLRGAAGQDRAFVRAVPFILQFIRAIALPSLQSSMMTAMSYDTASQPKTPEEHKHATQDTMVHDLNAKQMDQHDSIHDSTRYPMVDDLNAKQTDQHDSIHDSTRYRPTIRGVDAQKVDYLQPCQRGEMIEYPFGHRRQAVTVH